jgi:hypothetical protein
MKRRMNINEAEPHIYQAMAVAREEERITS